MSLPLRAFSFLALLGASALSPCFGQSQLVWHAESFMAQTDEPMGAVRFGADGRIVIAGEYRNVAGVNRSTMLDIRTADGVAVATTLWPTSPVGGYGWMDAAIGPGGEIALCGNAPGIGLIGLASPNGTLLFTPQTLPATCASARGVCFDGSGNLIATGMTSSSGVFVVRYSPQGALLGSTIWQHPSNGDDMGLRVAVDTSGNVYVLGYADMSNSPRVFVLKLDPALTLLWERERHTLVSLIPGPALVLDNQNEVLVACGSEKTGVTQEAFTLWKLDGAGTTAWVAQASDATHPSGFASNVALVPHGNAIVSGGWSGANGEALVQCYDASGTLLWSRSSGSPNDFYTSLAVDVAGDVLLAGMTGSAQLGLARRFDRFGSERWTYVDSNKTVRTGIGVAPDGGALLGCSCRNTFTPPYLHDYRLASAAFPVCAGDGAVAACPCANESLPPDRSGCLHSLGIGGHLDVLGLASLAQDTLVLFGSSMPNSPVIYFQGSLEVAPTAFGDGLRCAGGSLVRLAVRINQGGQSSYPGAADPPLSIAGGVGSASLRMYQAYFRDPAPFCTAATFNATNAVRVNWLP